MSVASKLSFNPSLFFLFFRCFTQAKAENRPLLAYSNNPLHLTSSSLVCAAPSAPQAAKKAGIAPW